MWKEKKYAIFLPQRLIFLPLFWIPHKISLMDTIFAVVFRVSAYISCNNFKKKSSKSFMNGEFITFIFTEEDSAFNSFREKTA